ncbi:MAG: DUF438 domain-containing protein [Candidatus Bathyarchaeota archaeon]|nr:DUF438 domain-containing protein [Candidatus Bathyarchaeota archaeon]MCX8177873.1 DUF438 domain-containing protein [Candidatus Bathyarchaeota archaeon]MDW8193590.1 DUF438 domain-containing protein [Nitrososphaerota archaeon]
MGGINEEERGKLLKEVLRQLHAGAPLEEVKERFRQVIEGTTPEEIAKIEQELVEREGVSREQLQKLCDLHLAIFREQLAKQPAEAPAENPISILREEHKILTELSEKLKASAAKVQSAEEDVREEVHQIRHIVNDLLDAEKHYLREENALFPVLEKHGITEPPAIMWMEHNQLRERKKQLHMLMEKTGEVTFQDFKRQLAELSKGLADALSSHIYKENSILFPIALKVVTENEWRVIREDFDEIGYCCFTPAHIKAETGPAAKPTAAAGNALEFEAGSLTNEEVEAILNTLPVDITFVDRDDRVKYFNKAEKRIFVRTKAILGRKVQLCHPEKSVHIVNRILEAFKRGERNVAEFWIKAGDRLVHIRYFAVRDKNGRYLGTMEVTQDITDIKKIEGEKRLLDWEG